MAETECQAPDTQRQSLPYLPIEIWQEIISSPTLDHGDQARLARVSRTLHGIVPQKLYSEVRLFVRFGAEDRDAKLNMTSIDNSLGETLGAFHKLESVLKYKQFTRVLRIFSDEWAYFTNEDEVASENEEKSLSFEIRDILEFFRGFPNVITFQISKQGVVSCHEPQGWRMYYNHVLQIVETAAVGLQGLKSIHIDTDVGTGDHDIYKRVFPANQEASLEAITLDIYGYALLPINTKRTALENIVVALPNSASTIERLELHIEHGPYLINIRPLQHPLGKVNYPAVKWLKTDVRTLSLDPSSWLGVRLESVTSLIVRSRSHRTFDRKVASFLLQFPNTEDLTICSRITFSNEAFDTWAKLLGQIVEDLPRLRKLKIRGRIEEVDVGGADVGDPDKWYDFEYRFAQGVAILQSRREFDIKNDPSLDYSHIAQSRLHDPM